jgi:U4/U6.U5 tri-snRNP-associated protein 1
MLVSYPFLSRVLSDNNLTNAFYAENFEVSDYMTEDTTFKKKKRKTKRNSRKADVGAEEEVEGATNGDVEMNSEEKSAVKQLDRTLQDNLVDDDELALALSRSRKQATMKRSKRMRPEDIAQQVADREEAAEAEPETVDVGEGLTFDDTSEFVRNVTLDSLVKREPRVKVEPESLVPELPHNVTVKQEPGEEPEIRVKIETTDDGEPLGGLEMDTAAQDVPMEDGELSEEDDDLAEMALRQGLSLEEMRLKLDSELQVKEETKEDVSCKPLVAESLLIHPL